MMKIEFEALAGYEVGTVKLVQHRGPRKACCPPGSFYIIPIASAAFL